MANSLPIIVGVTGTNGKTSVTTMVTSLMNRLGVPAAALGQRIETPSGVRDRSEVPCGINGLPQYIEHLTLSEGLKVVAVEVYSAALAKGLHNLVQYDYAAFTNITEDHLNVHGSVEAYVKAKQTLLAQLKPQGQLILNPKSAGLGAIAEAASQQGLSYLAPSTCQTPFALSYQQSNCQMAVEIVRQIFARDAERLHQSPSLIRPELSESVLHEKVMALHMPPGRYELWRMPNGVDAVIDFAHNPGGIETVINDTRASRRRNTKIGFLLSSKGGWGATKRRAMADAAQAADLVVVTDDDPRKEDPTIIRAQLALSHRYKQVPLREQAIFRLCSQLQRGDVAIIAGRGADEQWQNSVGRYRYSDRDVLEQLGGVKMQ